MPTFGSILGTKRKLEHRMTNPRCPQHIRQLVDHQGQIYHSVVGHRYPGLAQRLGGYPLSNLAENDESGNIKGDWNLSPDLITIQTVGRKKLQERTAKKRRWNGKTKKCQMNEITGTALPQFSYECASSTYITSWNRRLHGRFLTQIAAILKSV